MFGRRSCASLAVLGLVALAACSSKGSDAATTRSSPASQSPPPAAPPSSGPTSTEILHSAPPWLTRPPVHTEAASAGSGACRYLTPALARRLVPGAGDGRRDTLPNADSCSYSTPGDSGLIMLEDDSGARGVRGGRSGFQAMVVTLGSNGWTLSRPPGIGDGAEQLYRPGKVAMVEWTAHGHYFELTMNRSDITSAQVTAAARTVAARTR